MAKKKTTPAKQFIAFDNDTEELIGIESLDDLKEMIACYADEQGYDAEAVVDLITVYELGPVKTIDAAHRGLEIIIED